MCSIAGRSLRIRLATDEIQRPAPTQFVPDVALVGAALNALRPSVTFVQIGAFDGLENDPLHGLVSRFGWRGVLVEPQPEAFKRLRRTYRDTDGLVLVQAAISPHPGSVTLWRVADPAPGDPVWLSQVASFSRELVVAHLGDHPGAHDRVEPLSVDAITLDDAFARAPGPVDVLQVDAEGADAQILECLDFDSCAPVVVQFEHKHLGPDDYQSAVQRLAANGYSIAAGQTDTLAARLDAFALE